MMKKIVGLIVSITMFISLFTFAEAAEIEKNSAFDVAAFLNRIGISAVYSEDSYITRGDFAVLAAEIMKTDVFTDESIFTDVSGEQGKYINTLAYMGIISVNAEKKFYPDRIITLEEAVTILIRILGYDVIMTDNTFPTGYMNEARKLKLLTNVTTDSQVSGADAAYLIFNMLNCKYVEQVSSTSTDATYVLSENTCLEQNFNVFKKSGNITSICGLTLNGYKGVSSDEIIISGIIYENPHYAYVRNYTLLGHRVNYYIMETEESYEVVYIQDYTDTLKIYSNQINRVVGFDSKDSSLYRKNPELSYENDAEKNETVKLDVNATIFINAANKVSVSNSDFKPETGVVYLTDSNSDGKYDVIAIEKYSYYYVSAFDPTERVIADKYGKESLRLNEFDEEKILLENNGEPLSDDFFTQGTVVELMCSYTKDGSIDYNKFAKVSLAPEKINGVISSYDNEYFYINDYPYSALPKIREEVRSQMGFECTYYIGCGGVIVAYDKVTVKDGSIYAYLVGIYQNNNRKTQYAFKMFSERGEYLILDSTEILYYTGIYDGRYVERKKIKNEEIIETINVKELIKFKTNDEGLITDIYSACDMSEDSDYLGFDESRFTLDYKKDGLLLASGATDDGYIMSGETVCIFINGDGTEEENFEIGPYNLRGSTLGENTTNLNVKIYDATKKLTGAVAVIENAPQKDETVGEKFYSISSMWVVTDKMMALDDDDEFRCKITVARGTQSQSFFAKTDDLAPLNVDDDEFKNVNVTKFTELEIGDIISVQLNTAGNISSYIIINDYDETHSDKLYQDYVRQYSKTYLASFRRMSGNVTKFVPGSYVMIDSGSSYNNKRFSIGRNTPTYMVVNTNTGEVVATGSSTILNEGDYVWTYANKGEIRMIVKYVKE